MDPLTFPTLCLKEMTETTVSPPLTSSVTPTNPFNLLLLILDQIILNTLVTILPLVLLIDFHIPQKSLEQTLVIRRLTSGTWNSQDLMSNRLSTLDRQSSIPKLAFLLSISQRRGSAPQSPVVTADVERCPLSQYS
jgi:hypothetical protein